MAFNDFIAEDRRLAELRFLADDADYTIGESVMQVGLAEIGHSVSREVIKADFDFLRDLGLITVRETFEGTFLVAKLTGRGEDVAAGRTIVHGIKRPRPE